MTSEQLPLSLAQAKDEIARKHGYTDLVDLWRKTGYEMPVSLANEAAELFCQSHKAKAFEEGQQSVVQYQKILDEFYGRKERQESQRKMFDEVITIYSRWANNGDVNNSEDEAFKEIESKFAITRRLVKDQQ